MATEEKTHVYYLEGDVLCGTGNQEVRGKKKYIQKEKNELRFSLSWSHGIL